MNATFYKFDNFNLDTHNRQLTRKNNQIELSSKAFDILEFLIENRERIVTKAELFDSIWSDSFVEENNLPVHISALRRVLGEKRGETKFIKTIFGSGYKFIASVTEAEKSVEREFFQSVKKSFRICRLNMKIRIR